MADPARTFANHSFHRLRDDVADALGCLDEVAVGQMRVTRRGLVPPVPEQLADQGQVFARHDGVTGSRVPKVMQALAHKVRNQIEAAYRRSDLFERRRRLMDDWAGYLAGGGRKP